MFVVYARFIEDQFYRIHIKFFQYINKKRSFKYYAHILRELKFYKKFKSYLDIDFESPYTKSLVTQISTNLIILIKDLSKYGVTFLSTKNVIFKDICIGCEQYVEADGMMLLEMIYLIKTQEF